MAKASGAEVPGKHDDKVLVQLVLTHSAESSFLRHPGIPDGRKIWQKNRKIRKKDLFLVTYQ